MRKIIKWKHEGVKCRNCGEQAVVKGYCRKCYDHTPKRINKGRINVYKIALFEDEIEIASRKEAIPFIKLYNELKNLVIAEEVAEKL
jgi:hypothetical protein